MKYSHSKAMAVFYKIVKLVKATEALLLRLLYLKINAYNLNFC
jgi:hypothetical protein